MKKFLDFILSILFLILNLNFSNQLFAQWSVGPELLIRNNSSPSFGDTLVIKFFPVGAVYNFRKEYSPLIGGASLHSGYPYLAGFRKTLFNVTDTNNRVFGQFDGLGFTQQCGFAYGLGLYKLEFYRLSQNELLN